MFEMIVVVCNIIVLVLSFYQKVIGSI